MRTKLKGIALLRHGIATQSIVTARRRVETPGESTRRNGLDRKRMESRTEKSRKELICDRKSSVVKSKGFMNIQQHGDDALVKEKRFMETEVWSWIRLALEIAAIVLIILAVVWVCKDTGLAEEANGRCWVLCDPESHVCLRSGPRKKAPDFGSAECGTMLRTDSEEKDGWIHVVDLAAEEDSGWISLRYIVFDEPEEVERQMVVRSNGKVAIRKWVDGKITGWLHDGDILTVHWMSPSWAVTNRGYVMSEYLESIPEPDGEPE